jgi:hypothetical protein
MTLTWIDLVVTALTMFAAITFAEWFTRKLWGRHGFEERAIEFKQLLIHLHDRADHGVGRAPDRCTYCQAYNRWFGR